MAHFLESKKGEDILVLDIKEIASFTDYFVIVSGSSNRMLQSLSSGLVREIKTHFHRTAQPEGRSSAGWIVLDYGDVVVHLFSPLQRNYYRLEELWSEGNVVLRLM
ncbi:MAG TPA: ribosome silencing factor [Brevefilum sp.]|nr:ribosome silencing factor [Brevefilum sp.]HOR19815.1 ribosome silencing factor [Brevefilum sp.]HPL68870.1 ribosome silencing factor [Brevefilum sp.]